jgi:hypothetical protein
MGALPLDHPLELFPVSWYRPPDFELYDNVGRTDEQIHAYNTNSPTKDDLRRWAARDAKPFTESITAPPAGEAIAAWTGHLTRAGSVAEFTAVTDAVLGDGDHNALAELHLFLETAATWCEQHQEPGLADRYRKTAEGLSALDDQLYHLGEDHLRADCDRRASPSASTTPRATAPTAQTPPANPPAPPAPSKGRPR